MDLTQNPRDKNGTSAEDLAVVLANNASMRALHANLLQATGAGLKVLAANIAADRLPNLKELKLIAHSLDTDGVLALMSALAVVGGPSGHMGLPLATLDLKNARLVGESARMLARAVTLKYFASLTSVTLRQCLEEIDCDGFDALILALSLSPALRTLNLSCNSIPDEVRRSGRT